MTSSRNLEENEGDSRDRGALPTSKIHHELRQIERENSFESIQRMWEEISAKFSNNKDRSTQRTGPGRVPPRRQWTKKNENDLLEPASSVKIIMIKEASMPNKCESTSCGDESCVSFLSSQSSSELNTTGVNTEEPLRKSIGVNTSPREEQDKGNTIYLCTPKQSSCKVQVPVRKSSSSRIPRPIKSPPLKSEDCNQSTEEAESEETTSFSLLPPPVLRTPTDCMQIALKTVNNALVLGKFDDDVAPSMNIVSIEWFSVAGRKNSHPVNVQNYLESFKSYSSQLLRYVVNLPDESGITVLHYSVSYENFGVVSSLLDTGVCDPNKVNKAGYNSIMLASLAKLKTEMERNTMRKLLKLGDVNTKAAQHGQTALMLAAAHGRYECAKLLVEAGADLNIQDEDGSTALMCAAEHGHVDIVQFLLAQLDCNPNISDNDGSTALNVALDAGHKDIAVLLYAHMHFIQKGTGLSSPCGVSVLAKRSVSTVVRSRHSKSPGEDSRRGSSSNIAKKQQSSIN